MFWLYDRPYDVTIEWIRDKFSKKPEIAQANETALKAGFHFGETAEMFRKHFPRREGKLKPGVYRNITGNEATALGFIAASQLAGTPLLYASYPITPASDILHELSKHKNFGVQTLQMEDEIAAAGAALGASFAGGLGLTGTSGPGLALKAETINLAIMTELPLVVIDVQRGGPSTGLPTKTEQADLLRPSSGGTPRARWR
jgi:2-oxoglutarate ferredoxin oxidoreductase subunit alpha